VASGSLSEAIKERRIGFLFVSSFCSSIRSPLALKCLSVSDRSMGPRVMFVAPNLDVALER